MGIAYPPYAYTGSNYIHLDVAAWAPMLVGPAISGHSSTPFLAKPLVDVTTGT